ncbi:alpha-amylase family glycosyl hydrolase [Bacillus sp. SCS-151]|uniref:alpha-amylase family glycosyl hydrolase n=1 Tax=Nanhaiella sioensis TaxID=3115293 RepID=UPI0039782420
MKKRLLAFLFIPFILIQGVLVQAENNEAPTLEDETIYYVIVEKFFNGDVSNDQKVPNDGYGGDIKGVIQKLDYIEEMGFSTIMLSSIFNDDFSNDNENLTIKEYFGTKEDLIALVDEAHKRNMKIIVDVETTMEMPNNIAEAYISLQEETDIDGYHILNIGLYPSDFWKEFINDIKSSNQNLFLLADELTIESQLEHTYNGIGFDAIVSRSYYEEASSKFVTIDQPLDTINNVFNETNNNQEQSETTVKMIDSPQTDRFTRKATALDQYPVTRIKQALVHLYTTPGAPVVLYGSEIALDGGNGIPNQLIMNFRTEKELSDYITKLSELRSTLPSLTYGDFEMLYEEDGMLVFKRTYKEETAIAVINNTSETKTVHLDTTTLEDEKELRGLLAGDLIRSDEQGYKVTIDREEAEIYVLAEKTGVNLPFMLMVFAVPALFLLFLFANKKVHNK